MQGCELLAGRFCRSPSVSLCCGKPSYAPSYTRQQGANICSKLIDTMLSGTILVMCLGSRIHSP